jgi:hypothetical protein
MVFALQGVAYDKMTSQPLAGAKISVVGTNGSNFSAMTDENGGFNFAENGKDRYIKENTSYSILAEQGRLLGGEGPGDHRGTEREHHLREGVLPAARYEGYRDQTA